MKKIFKIIGIIVIVIVVLIGAVFGYTKIKQSMMNNERRNARTLMEYVKTHSWEYLDCSDSNCLDMYFVENKFICDIDYNNIKYFQSGYFVTKNNEIYDISFGKLYSNNQNCKKATLDTNIKAIKGNYVLDKNNNLYTLQQNDRGKRILQEYSNALSYEKTIIDLMNNDNIDYIYNITSDYSKGEIYALILKSDNNIYKLIYKDGSGSVVFDKEELYKSLKEYGNIQEIVTSNYYTSNSGKDYQLEDNTITTIISDKGYYYLDEVKTDECSKYKDIECKLELKESEIYKKFSKDIKYIGQQYTILSDDSVIRTGYLTYPLDKDLRN